MQQRKTQDGEPEAAASTWSSGKWTLVAVLVGLIALLAYPYLSAIPAGVGSFLLFLAVCGGMHVFMHRAMGHGGHDRGGHGQAGHRRRRAPHDDDDWPDDGRGVA